MSTLQKNQIRLLNEHEVAEMLRLSVATIRRWRVCGRGPKYLKLLTSVRYEPHALRQWLASRPTGGGG
jgi:predicted DNA-binding transcriptional regulator AlpA